MTPHFQILGNRSPRQVIVGGEPVAHVIFERGRGWYARDIVSGKRIERPRSGTNRFGDRTIFFSREYENAMIAGFLGAGLLLHGSALTEARARAAAEKEVAKLRQRESDRQYRIEGLAPEAFKLLTALEKAYHTSMNADTAELWDAARALLAKAEGV